MPQVVQDFGHQQYLSIISCQVQEYECIGWFNYSFQEAQKYH